jgi:lysophospholipase L1-like esterase
MKKNSLALLAALALATPFLSFPVLAENTATNGASRPGPWLTRHEGFVAEAKKGGIDVLFLGDSITDHWRDKGSNIWETTYAPLHAANFGISGDRTQNVLWRMDHGELDGLHPKVVVLMIGTNNTGKEKDKTTIRNTPPQVIEGVTAIIADLRKKLPRSKILLLAVFPRDKPGSPIRDELKETNAGLAKLDDGKMIKYLDIGPQFLAPDGVFLPGVMGRDNLHPTDKGYAVWAKAMQPTLDAMLK